MSIQLDLDQMREIIVTKISLEQGEAYATIMAGIANAMADVIQTHQNKEDPEVFQCDSAVVDRAAFGGICVPFYSFDEDNPGPVPDLLQGYDDKGWE